MKVFELINDLQRLRGDTQVFVEAEDGTLNSPVLEEHLNNGAAVEDFIVLALPDTYDTYGGPIQRG